MTFYEKLSKAHKKKTKWNYSVIILSESKHSWFTFNFFHYDGQVSSLTHILDNLKQRSSQ